MGGRRRRFRGRGLLFEPVSSQAYGVDVGCTEILLLTLFAYRYLFKNKYPKK